MYSTNLVRVASTLHVALGGYGAIADLRDPRIRQLGSNCILELRVQYSSNAGLGSTRSYTTRRQVRYRQSPYVVSGAPAAELRART